MLYHLMISYVILLHFMDFGDDWIVTSKPLGKPNKHMTSYYMTSYDSYDQVDSPRHDRWNFGGE